MAADRTANCSNHADRSEGRLRHGDAQLIDAVRQGDVAAYETLYARHVASARNLARQLSRTCIEADDLVSEAFIRVLHKLCAGGGPDSTMRAYLFTTLRHVAYDRTRQERRIELHGDIGAIVDSSSKHATVEDGLTAMVDKTTAGTIKKVFGELPERWRGVLWLTEVQRMTPAEVAPRLGLTPNAVSALAFRARRALRLKYRQASTHAFPTGETTCVV